TAGVAAADGTGIALSALTARRMTTRFDIVDGRLFIAAVEPSELEPAPVLWRARRGDRLRTEPFVMSGGNDMLERLRHVAAQVRGRRGSPIPRGWLSWYHYGPWVSADDVAANAAAIHDGPLAGLGYDVVQIDDGWQELYGDWVPNGKFPGGLAEV